MIVPEKGTSLYAYKMSLFSSQKLKDLFDKPFKINKLL